MPRQHLEGNRLAARLTLVVLSCIASLRATAASEAAAFDLVGPALTVTVTRGEATLPIDQVPNLREGDHLAVRADLPPNQAVKYLMVLAFLRGATNPPPKDWFFSCETWRGACAKDGLKITVPEGAQQVLVLFAPSTSGDLRTLVGAITGKPGAFVRSSQALNQAALDRSRLDTYLAALSHVDRTDRGHLKETAPLLARSLSLKVDERCLDRAPDLQAPCLMQAQETVVLNDGHSKTLVDTLTSGPSADLAMVAANTPVLGNGALGPYIASLLDIGRVLSNLRTAKYQYLPALAIPAGNRLQLSLNSPPSFNEPLSVLVSALPAVAKPPPPPLRAVDPTAQYCAHRPDLVLPVDGAPLVYSTRYAHELKLRIAHGDETIEVPAHVDVERGGFMPEPGELPADALAGQVRATIGGRWGFEPFTGPTFTLAGQADEWQLVDAQDASLVAGRDNEVHLKGDSVSCISAIKARDAAGVAVPVQWKNAGDGVVVATLDLQATQPGLVTLQVEQVGATQPMPLELHAFPDLVRVDSVVVSPTDGLALLKGNRLDQVAGLRIDHADFGVRQLLQVHGDDELLLATGNGAPLDPAPAPARLKARVRLAEGRTQQLAFTLAGPRPAATLVHKSVAHQPHGSGIVLRLGGDGDAAPDEAITFSVRVAEPGTFTASATIDVATADHHIIAQLAPGRGMTVVGAQLAIGTFTPSALLGPLATGQLQFRITTGGLPGDWQDLVHVVRLPELAALDCAGSTQEPCKLRGSGLFLLEQLRVGEGAGTIVPVPEGYTGDAISVPRSAARELGYALRDDPGVFHKAQLPAPANLP